MSWVKDAKASAMAKEAAEAWDAGALFFTPLMNMPATRVGFSGSISDWAQMLEAISQVGWQLHTWASGSDEKGRAQATPLFVRG